MSPRRQGEKGGVLVTVEAPIMVEAKITLSFGNLNPPSAKEAANMVRNTLDNALMNDDIDFVGDTEIALVGYRLDVGLVPAPGAKKPTKETNAVAEESLLP